MRTLLLGLIATLICSAQVPVLWDDDCTSDTDCAINVQAALNKMADQGYIKILAETSSTANAYAAPSMHVFSTYYGRPNTLIGAYQGNFACPNTGCNVSSWTAPLVAQFRPGDTRANYPDAVTVWRTILAANSGVTVIISGTWLNVGAVLASPADAISPFTGIQLLKTKVSKFVVVGGAYCSCYTEYNFQSDPSDASTFFSTVTTQNGYPPVWMVSGEQGGSTNAGAPSFAVSTVNPSRYVSVSTATNQRPLWDALAVMYAAWGLSHVGTTYLGDGGNGTQVVNSSTGANTWSTGTASGHHYLTNVASDITLSNIFDGFSYGFGFSSMPPLVGTGSLVNGAITIKNGITVR